LGHVHGHELVVEAPGLGGGERAPVRVEREDVLVFAGDAVALGHVLGRLSHRLGGVALGQTRVGEAPADRGVHERGVAARKAPLGLQHHERRARHRLHAAGQDEVRIAEPDLARRLYDRLEARGAEPVHRHARDLHWQPGDQCCHARDVPVVLAGLVGAAHVDLVDRGRVELVALDGRRDGARGKVVGAHAGEHPGVAADRGAQRVDDHGVRHGAAAYTRLAWTSFRCSSSSEGWW
jgi:hypothetical protein